MQVNMHEAKTRLSQLGELVLKGETVVIAKAGKPLFDLVPHRANRMPRKPGRLAGQIKLSPDFDETPEDVMTAFEGD